MPALLHTMSQSVYIICIFCPKQRSENSHSFVENVDEVVDTVEGDQDEDTLANEGKRKADHPPLTADFSRPRRNLRKIIYFSGSSNNIY
jgi:hypothetical protein